QLARDRLRRLQQRLLLLQAQEVGFQDLGRMRREPRLAGNRFGEADLGLGPRPWLRAVQGERSDQLVEDDDRGGEHGPRAQLDERLAAWAREAVDVFSRGDVGHDDRASLVGRAVRDAQIFGGVVDRWYAGPIPLG